jgi:hypothetical protein
MFGGIKVNEKWRERHNKELMQMFVDLDRLSFVKSKSVELDWSG